jgi:hypothetical protein
MSRCASRTRSRSITPTLIESPGGTTPPLLDEPIDVLSSPADDPAAAAPSTADDAGAGDPDRDKVQGKGKGGNKGEGGCTTEVSAEIPRVAYCSSSASCATNAASSGANGSSGSVGCSGGPRRAWKRSLKGREGKGKCTDGKASSDNCDGEGKGRGEVRAPSTSVPSVVPRVGPTTPWLDCLPQPAVAEEDPFDMNFKLNEF